MPNEIKMKTIKTFVFATNSEGAPELIAYNIDATRQEYDDGTHYEKAMYRAIGEKYNSLVVFDENDVAGRQLMGLKPLSGDQTVGTLKVAASGNSRIKRFTAIVRVHETEDARSFQIECFNSQKAVTKAVEAALLQDMIDDEMAKEGDTTEVVTERGYDLNGVIEGWHKNIFDNLPFGAEPTLVSCDDDIEAYCSNHQIDLDGIKEWAKVNYLTNFDSDEHFVRKVNLVAAYVREYHPEIESAVEYGVTKPKFTSRV